MQFTRGSSFPLGATVYPAGVNFSIFSKNAEKVTLLLFDGDRPAHLIAALQLDPSVNKTFYYWHCFVPHLKPGVSYGFRVEGPFDPERGLRFDHSKLLIDPYSRAVWTGQYVRKAAVDPGDNLDYAMKSVVVDPADYDWEGDRPLNYPFHRTIIYELHVGGFTRHPNSGLPDHYRGTYLALIEKIPYLKSLGITAVELLPVQQFDPFDAPSGTNYWGYSPVAFFAPHSGYTVAKDPLAPVREFRDMVKALHREGIEVILDVVFNHTAEGNQEGPTQSFRGLENLAYYLLESNKSGYANFTGTGNTLNANHSIVRRMIIDCLCHWVSEMHVDGFRFDLAAVLSRDEEGHLLKNPPVLWEIESHPVLASTKIIAEAWDVYAYQLGNFVGDRWAEWNGRFRDDVRRFIKSDAGMVPKMAQRVVASPDLFPDHGYNPARTINFVTCHDGFTLNDLVSYNDKHNWENGESNRDGTNDNHSWNCGGEGPTDQAGIEQLRRRQIRNALVLNLLTQGTPMILMGDEVRRSQRGNNNAYCQDNMLSWMDWEQVAREEKLGQFVQQLIRFRKSHGFFQEKHRWTEQGNPEGTRISFHGTQLHQPDWSEHSRSLAFTLDNDRYDRRLHVICNAYWEPLDFELPRPDDDEPKVWFVLFYTFDEVPDLEDRQLPPGQTSFQVAPRSMAVLISRNKAVRWE